MGILIVQALSVSALSGTRAALTLLGMAIAARAGYLDLPEFLQPLTSTTGLAVLGALVLLEEVVEGDEDIQELLGLVNYGLRGVAGAVASGSIGVASDGEVLTASVPILGAVVSTGTHYVRSCFHEQLRGMGDSLLSPRTWIIWLERGGMIGLLAAVFLAPVVALVFILLAGGLAAVGTFVRKQIERSKFRRGCPHCDFRARIEASTCAGCGNALEPAKWLVVEQ